MIPEIVPNVHVAPKSADLPKFADVPAPIAITFVVTAAAAAGFLIRAKEENEDIILYYSEVLLSPRFNEQNRIVPSYNMELFESHFSNLRGNLFYDAATNNYEMFSGKGTSHHINYLTFKKLFEQMGTPREPIILESGIASRGTQSTYLFNEVVRKYGGNFWSVDNDPELVSNHQGNMCPGTKLVHNDSVAFFKEWTSTSSSTSTYTSGIPKADIIYLDSYDLDFYNPEPSGKHGLAEYMALRHAIKKDTLLLIDDTPINPYWLDTRGALYNNMLDYYGIFGIMPGKGMYVLDEVKNAEKLIHNYQVLYRFSESPY